MEYNYCVTERAASGVNMYERDNFPDPRDLERMLTEAARYAHQEFDGGAIEIVESGIICKIIYRDRFSAILKCDSLTPWSALRNVKVDNPLITALNDLVRMQQKTADVRKAMVTP